MLETKLTNEKLMRENHIEEARGMPTDRAPCQHIKNYLTIAYEDRKRSEDIEQFV